MTATMTKHAIDAAGLEALASNNSDWLKADRQKGMELFNKLPRPVRTDESWRRTNPKLVSLDGKQVIAPESEFGTIEEGSVPEGVTYGALETLLTEKALADSKRPSEDGISCFTAVNEAFWQGGSYLEVAQDVSLGTNALHSKHHFTGGENALALPRSIVKVGKFSNSTILETFTSDEESLMASPLVDIEVAEGATLKYVIVQKWGTGTTSVPVFRARVAKDANLQVLYLGLGGQVTKVFGESDLEGEGCKSVVNGIVMASKKQHFDFDLNQYHRKGNNVSDVLVHIALADEARSVFSGNILCEPGSQGIDGYQQNRNLLLSSKARADSMPKLEIEANDVACTHGATFTTYDKDQSFYCRSRGMTETETQRLLVRGFFNEVVNRVEQTAVVDYLMELVADKMDHTLGK